MSRLSRFLVVLAPLAGLAACVHEGAENALRQDAITPTEQYSIAVTSQPEQIALKVRAGGLSPAQHAALADLAARWREQGSGDLTIETPTGGDPALSRLMADQSRMALIHNGVPGQRIALVGYNNAPDQPLTVRVGYLTHQAAGPDCGRDWDAFTKTGSNRPYKQFGCSVTANMAAQIDNAADLLAPRPMGPADATRRSVVLGKYRAGQVTSTPADPQAQVTQAGN